MNMQDFEKIKLLYEENSKVAHAFWDWRHRIMTRLFLTITSLVIAAGWFYQNQELKKWVFVPFVLIALFSLFSILLDWTNTLVLRGCYQEGAKLERIIDDNDHIFSVIKYIHYKRSSYHIVLLTLYSLCVFSSLILSVLSYKMYF
jgi:cytochrome bd-type quinol oxidase subunit 1